MEDKLAQMESSPEAAADEAKELHRLTFELRRWIGCLHGEASGWTGVPTAGQKAQVEYLTDAVTQIQSRVRALENFELPEGQ